jgi:5'(3')-deoxyribonucleotidase
MKHDIILYVDLDEVFADFIGDACKLFGCTRDEVEANRGYSEWSILDALSKTTGKTIDQETFWQKIRLYGPEFWELLDPLPWAIELYSYLESTRLPWHIVTTPGPFEESETGKRRWIKQFFGPEFDRYHMTPHKHLFSRPGAVLIDDSWSNIKKFITAHRFSGKGILFPSQGNVLVGSHKTPLDLVKIELDKIVKHYTDL